MWLIAVADYLRIAAIGPTPCAAECTSARNQESEYSAWGYIQLARGRLAAPDAEYWPPRPRPESTTAALFTGRKPPFETYIKWDTFLQPHQPVRARRRRAVPFERHVYLAWADSPPFLFVTSALPSHPEAGFQSCWRTS